MDSQQPIVAIGTQISYGTHTLTVLRIRRSDILASLNGSDAIVPISHGAIEMAIDAAKNA